MAEDGSWLSKLVKLAASVEDGVDAVRYGIRARLGAHRGLHIATYRTYGTTQRLRIAGRVLRDGAELPGDAQASTWANLRASYRRFETDEVPGAHLAVTFGGVRTNVVADAEGYFEATIALAAAIDAGDVRVHVELVEPRGAAPVTATATVLVPAATARFGVISDIDDTVIQTDVSDVLRLARAIVLGNAHTRLPFPGVGAFYRALRDGPGGSSNNPMFYVSSSPWNLYELLDELFRLRDIPRGPIMLRDWGLSSNELLPTRHAGHKRAAIARILETYPTMTFVLVGDSGQEDPEIYASVMREHPGRVLAAYIRDVSLLDTRRSAIRALADELHAQGATLVLTADTMAAARHAAQHGWIEPSRLTDVEADRA